jgi:hypothetical protein
MITIVGIFDRFAPAQSARNELVASGFTWRQVQLSPDHETAPRPNTAHRQADDQSVDATVGNLVRGLLGVGAGNRSAHGDLYGIAARHGDYALIVDASDEQQSGHAEDIMRRFQPVDIVRRT